jgi:hypothetical protein
MGCRRECEKDLPLHRGAVGSVVAAPALLVLEVDGAVLMESVGVARRQNSTGPHVALGAVFAGEEQALVEDRELIAGPYAAREVHVPREDLREIVGQLRVLTQCLDCLVERGGHNAGDPRALSVQRGLVSGCHVAVAFTPNRIVLEG